MPESYQESHQNKFLTVIYRCVLTSSLMQSHAMSIRRGNCFSCAIVSSHSMFVALSSPCLGFAPNFLVFMDFRQSPPRMLLHLIDSVSGCSPGGKISGSFEERRSLRPALPSYCRFVAISSFIDVVKLFLEYTLATPTGQLLTASAFGGFSYAYPPSPYMVVSPTQTSPSFVYSPVASPPCQVLYPFGANVNQVSSVFAWGKPKL